MKNYKAILATAVLGLVTAALFTACEKGPNFREFNYGAPVVTDFSPKTGYAGNDVIITGSHFGDLTKAVKVYFGGILADTVRSVADNQIVVQAPAKGISGIITVEYFGKKDTTTESFVYKPSAKIISLSTDKAKAGDEVTITGENFGTDASLVQVFIGTAATTVVSVSPTAVKFKVPDVSSGNVIMVVDGQRLTGPYLLVGLEKLVGTLIGHSGSWSSNPATTIAAAVDGDITTAVDAPTKTGYVGYDMGAGKGAILKSVRYVPRSTNASRMLNGEIRGANDPTLYDFETLYTITSTPPVGVYTEAAITSAKSFRYIYYYSADGYCNIAEIEFYGNYVDKPIPAGKLTWEFNTAGDNEGWVPQQSGTWSVAGGAMTVGFTQTSGAKRADLKQTTLPVILHTGDYPIVAIKFNKPTAGNITFDTESGSFGNGSNKYSSDYAAKDVYYWDISALTLGGNGIQTNTALTFTKTFQFKIADIPSDNPATGYTVQWIRTFSSKTELENFIK